MSNIFSNFPVIQIGEYILKEITKEDIATFYNYIIHPKVSRYLSDDEIPDSLAEAEEELMYWANLFTYKRSFYWGIFKVNSPHIIGTCGFNNWSLTHKRAEVSYDLSHSYWGRGITTKALGAICSFAFSQMQVNRIQATVATDNFGSIRVLDKANFKQEGMLRNYGVLQKKPRDFYMYSLIDSDIIF